MSGNIAPLFWAGVVMMGLVAPFSVDAVCRRLPAPVAVVLGRCLCVGGRFVPSSGAAHGYRKIQSCVHERTGLLELAGLSPSAP